MCKSQDLLALEDTQAMEIPRSLSAKKKVEVKGTEPITYIQPTPTHNIIKATNITRNSFVLIIETKKMWRMTREQCYY